MQINFYAMLRPLAGGKTVEVSASPTTCVRDALRQATKDKPKLAEAMWESNGLLKSHIKVFVNGRQSVHLPQDMETPLSPDDTLDVFPPVGGGAD